MLRKRLIPPDHMAFAPLPISSIPLSGGINAAVHIAGNLSSARLPVICLAGYQRNMSDFTEFAAYFRRMGGGDWPVILVDLPGRGRADDRRLAEDYNSRADADDVASVMTALGVGHAVVLGQGHGGQVAMLLAAHHPLMIAGTILLDAGPVTDSRGIVRLRNNMQHIDSLRGNKAIIEVFRRILGGDYPGLSDARLDGLIGRSHYVDRRGRARSLFDPRLLKPLEAINFDDVLMPQWPLFDALTIAPLLLLRTQLTDQLRRETLDEMRRRRPDALALTISGQGSPALFDQSEEIEAVARFVLSISQRFG